MQMKMTRKWISGMPRELQRRAARCTTMERPARRELRAPYSAAQCERAARAASSDAFRADLAAIIGPHREVSVTTAAQQLRLRGWRVTSNFGLLAVRAEAAGFIVRHYIDGNTHIMTTIGVKGEDEFLAD